MNGQEVIASTGTLPVKVHIRHWPESERPLARRTRSDPRYDAVVDREPEGLARPANEPRAHAFEIDPEGAHDNRAANRDRSDWVRRRLS